MFGFLSRTKRAEEIASRGVGHVDAGDFSLALEAFRRAVELAPEVASHRLNFAYAAQQTGAAAEALPMLQRAAELDPQSFDAHYMLGAALEEAGLVPEAAECFRRACAIKPDFEQAHVDAARVLVQAEDVRGAKAFVEEALGRLPRSAALHLALGNVHMAESQAEAAIESFDRAIALDPALAAALSNRALALHAAGRFDDAIDGQRAALALDPNLPAAHEGLGRSQQALKRWAEAETSWRRVIELRPDDAEACNTLGIVLHAAGRTDDAVVAYRRAIALRPNEPGAYANLGLALADQGFLPAAVAEYRKSLAVKEVAEAHDNLAIALQKLGAVDEAIDHYRRALALKPDNRDTQSNLAGALADGEHPRASIAAYRTLLERHPEHRTAHSNLLMHLCVDDEVPVADYLAEARRYGSLVTPADVVTLAPRPPDGRRLRLGFVSGDLRTHPVGLFLEGILRHLDPTRVSLHAYPTITRRDALTERIAPRFETWRRIKGLSDANAAQVIRDDRIDVLFDLSGHTGDNRLPVFAQRAAPVQVTWLGYFASTGVPAMDYVLADDVCVPPGAEVQFTERVWRLPKTRLCYTPPDDAVTPPVAASPASERGFVTFASFQRLGKVTDEVLRVWGRIFERLPTARLRLQAHQTGRDLYIRRTLDRLAAVGIRSERVSIRPPTPRLAYLEAHADVDIVLDTFPYTGGTTTCEALWMGVPTLTLTGQTMISRQGVAMLGAAGLPDWIALSRDDYVDRAVRHASDIPALARLRAGLRDQVRSSPLFDVERFAERLVDALDDIHADAVDRAARDTKRHIAASDTAVA